MLSLNASIISRRSRGAMAPSCTARSTIALNPSDQPARFILNIGQNFGDRIAFLLVHQLEPAIVLQLHRHHIGIANKLCKSPSVSDRHRQKTHRDSNRMSHQAHAQAMFSKHRPKHKAVNLAITVAGNIADNCTARRFSRNLERRNRMQWSMAQTSGRLWNREKLP